MADVFRRYRWHSCWLCGRALFLNNSGWCCSCWRFASLPLTSLLVVWKGIVLNNSCRCCSSQRYVSPYSVWCCFERLLCVAPIDWRLTVVIEKNTKLVVFFSRLVAQHRLIEGTLSACPTCDNQDWATTIGKVPRYYRGIPVIPEVPYRGTKKNYRTALPEWLFQVCGSGIYILIQAPSSICFEKFLDNGCLIC